VIALLGAIVGALIAAVTALVVALYNRRAEHQKWLREKRLDAYAELCAEYRKICSRWNDPAPSTDHLMAASVRTSLLADPNSADMAGTAVTELVTLVQVRKQGSQSVDAPWKSFREMTQAFRASLQNPKPPERRRRR
jgi:hypothetical protein